MINRMKMRGEVAFIFIGILATCSSAANLCSKTECVRLPFTVDFGYTPDLRRLLVDVGSCSTLTNCSSDSGSSNVSNVTCGAELLHCTPASFEMKSFSNRSGPFLVTTITSCTALVNESCGECRRWPKPVTVLPASGYEQTVDIGSCEGQCMGTNNECVPIVKRTISLEGPNGDLLVDQIKECGCHDSRCYKQDYFESHLELIRNSNGSEEAVHKLINVGRCAGTCEGIILRPLCYPSPDFCLLRINPQKSSCSPVSSSTTTFTGLDGNMVSITLVEECSCVAG